MPRPDYPALNGITDNQENNMKRLLTAILLLVSFNAIADETYVITIPSMFGKQTNFTVNEDWWMDAKVSTPITIVIQKDNISSPQYDKCVGVTDKLDKNNMHIICQWIATVNTQCSGVGTFLFLPPNKTKTGMVLHSQTRSCPSSTLLRNDARALIGNWTLQ
jgi:hypothetical protein